jgi:predicted dehydrogenase
MLDRSGIDAVFVLTGPGTHAPFALAAVQAGKHVLLQKPMVLSLADANAIVDAVRRAGVKALIEPSSDSPLDPLYPRLRDLILKGVLGQPYWFTWMPAIPTSYQPRIGGLGGNPYGVGAFYARDSGGMLMDFPYAPTQIVSLLGSCKTVTGLAKVSVPDRVIVPDEEYDRFLQAATDPENTNYWDVVFGLPRTRRVTMEAEDNAFSLYEMDGGAIGVFHIARPLHPMPPGAAPGGLRIYGTEGNLATGVGGHRVSLLSTRTDLLPTTDGEGWYHVPPDPAGFNYYQHSARHLLDCIQSDRDPLLNVEWGRHVTEMMIGALESSRTGTRYDMTTTLTRVRLG